ncbi:hypothetical protein NQ314_000010 [Rhamnusium bicolor]|uniref:Uncharacterized protein n=1 Tax=Rhamnusium bicolor TaxID=1586634 RepID=A0AAV8ZWA9_9CUCU|nr:hypothetical protein NQ314_000010 [Rhamnusium bicolor]
MNVFLPLMKSLAEKGHDVTVISPFPLENPTPNYKDVSLKDLSSISLNTINMEEISVSRFRKYGIALYLSRVASNTCENVLSSKTFQTFMNTEENVDLIIAEFFNTDCFLCLVQKFKSPIIGVSTSTLMPWTSDRLANPTHTAYIPNNLMDYSDHMEFFERVENTLVTLFHKFFYEYVILRQDEHIIRKYFGKKSSTLKDFVMNSSLLLVNTHFTLNLPRPLVPNIIEIGGIHIERPKPLPKPVLNYKDISLRGNSQVFVEIVDMEEIDAANRFHKYNNILMLSDSANYSCEIGLSSQNVHNFVKSKDKFDIIVMEFFNSDCFFGIAHQFKVPIVGLSSCTMMPWTSGRFANPTHTAYIPNNMMDYSDKMSFLERLENTLVNLYHQYYYEYFMITRDEQIARKHLGTQFSRLKDFISNSSLLLVNAHFSLTLPRPLVPNIVEVGGIHIGGIQRLPKVRIQKSIRYMCSGLVFI